MDKHKIVLHQPEWGYTEQSKYLFLSDLLPRVVPKISYFQRRCISLWKNVEIGYSDFFEYFPSLSFWQKLLTEFDLWTASGLCIPCSSVTFFSWKSWVSTFFLQKSPWSALHIASIFPQSCCSFSNRRTPILPLATAACLNSGRNGAAEKPCGPTVSSAQRKGNPLRAKYRVWQERRGSLRTSPY